MHSTAFLTFATERQASPAIAVDSSRGIISRAGNNNRYDLNYTSLSLGTPFPTVSRGGAGCVGEGGTSRIASN